MGNPLSLVIPAYNESHRLPLFLKTFATTLGRRPDLKLELIVVEDGSRADNVAAVAEALEGLRVQCPGLEIRHEKLAQNQGKGAAIAHGFRAARSDLVGFLDADGSTSLFSWLELADRLASDAHLASVIGSRIKMLGRDVTRSNLRHYVGRVFATYVSQLFSIPVYDSQCGAKLYRLSKVRGLLGEITDPRFVWDTQLLILIHRDRLAVVEHPVDWKEIGNNRVSLFRDPLKMAWALLKFKLNRR